MFQKILVGIALSAFIVTLFRVPWMLSGAGGDYRKTVVCPLWKPPNWEESTIVVSIQWPTILVQWAAIGILYAGTSYVFRSKK